MASQSQKILEMLDKLDEVEEAIDAMLGAYTGASYDALWHAYRTVQTARFLISEVRQ